MLRTAIFAVALAECARVDLVEDRKQELDRALQISGCTAVIDSGQAIWINPGSANNAVVYDIRAGGADQLHAHQETLTKQGHFRGAIDGGCGPQIRAALTACLEAGCRVPPKAGGQPYVKEK